MTKLTQNIRMKSGKDEETGEDFDTVFPEFYWLIRDAHLRPTVDNKPATENEYLEHILKLKPGAGSEVEKYNASRRALRTFFKSRHLIMLVRPLDDDTKLNEIDKVSYEQLKPQFRRKVEELVDSVLSKPQPKTLFGTPLNGRSKKYWRSSWQLVVFASLAERYVTAINEGAVPVIHDAWEYLKRHECQEAVNAGIQKYCEVMDRKKYSFPIETEELLSAHHAAVDQAFDIFCSRVLSDDDHTYQAQLQVIS